MHLFQLPHTRTGKCISMMMCATLAGAGLMTFSCIPTASSDPSEFLGLLVNADISSNFLGGIRLESGERLSVFGEFNEDGSVRELQEIVFEDADGKTASLQFASGRPSAAELPDGSTLTITYDQADLERLKGVVDIQPAQGDAVQVPFDVDMQLALNQLAQLIEDATGGAVQIAPDDGADSATARTLESTTQRLLKDAGGRQQFGVGALVFGAILATYGFLVVCAMPQIMESVLQAVEDSMRVLVIAIFAPIIILGEICRLSATRPTLIIEVEITPDFLPNRHH